MSMSISFISILVSLAMMLTGFVPGETPAMSRTLTISDITLEVNGYDVELDPVLKLGAATDGNTALFDMFIDMDGETLLPIQIAADADAVKLTAGSQGVGVTKAALSALEAQMEQMIASSQAQAQGDSENQAIFDCIINDLIPAYVALIDAAQDPERSAEIQEKGNAMVKEKLDRGEPTPDTVTLGDDVEFNVDVYHYTLDTAQIYALSDEIYTCDEVLANYYDALFKLYSLLPEESGLNGITSFTDLSAMLPIDILMEIEEQVSEADNLDITQGTITMTIPAELTNGEELPPITMDFFAGQKDDESYGSLDMNYEYNDFTVVLNTTIEAYGQSYNFDFDIDVTGPDASGEEMTAAISFGATKDVDEETGAIDYEYVFNENVEGQAELGFSIYGETEKDGTGTVDFDFEGEVQGVAFELSFEATCADEEIANRFDGVNVVMIEDLSEEGLNALGEDPAIQGVAMQAMGSLMVDAQKLMADDSVQRLVAMFTPAAAEQ